MIKPIENILNKQINRIENLIKDSKGKQLYISQLTGSFKSLLLSKLIEKEKQILVLLPEIKFVEEFVVELSILGLADRLISITEFKPESLQEKLTDIINRKSFILISSYKLLNYEFPEKDKLEQQTTKINAEGGIKYDELIEYLNLLNYQKDKFVEAPGEYSQRGSIIDFWSFSEPNPVRLEFDGDFIESIRYFEPESQRSVQLVETVTLAASAGENFNGGNLTTIFEYLDNPLVIASSFELENLKNENVKMAPAKEEITFPDQFVDVDGDVFTEVELDKNSQVSHSEERPPNLRRQDGSDEESQEKILRFIQNDNARWLIEESLGTEKVELGFIEPPSVNGNFEILFNILKEYSDSNFQIVITSENEFQTYKTSRSFSRFQKRSFRAN